MNLIRVIVAILFSPILFAYLLLKKIFKHIIFPINAYIFNNIHVICEYIFKGIEKLCEILCKCLSKVCEWVG